MLGDLPLDMYSALYVAHCRQSACVLAVSETYEGACLVYLHVICVQAWWFGEAVIWWCDLLIGVAYVSEIGCLDGSA